MIDVDDDDAMMDTYGFTKHQLQEMIYRGQDIGGAPFSLPLLTLAICKICSAL